VSPSRRTLLIVALALAAMASALTWAALAPIASSDRDEVFEIPKGTWARRMAGDKVEILPREVRLVLGVKDVLVLRNLDDVPQVFGPVLMMPGQSFRLPFETASSYQFACTAHASGQMTVTVLPNPEAGWERLAWRARALGLVRPT
jgi:plastocyanin